jgi:hypothetical protein
MIMRMKWISVSTIALGAMMLLMAGVAGAADTAPDQSRQPTGSVRHAKKRVARPPSAAGTDTSVRQRQGRSGATRQPQAPVQRDASRNRSGAQQRSDRVVGRDRDASGGGARDGRGDQDDGSRGDNRGRQDDGERHEFRGIRGLHSGAHEFHRGSDSVRVYGKRPLRGSVFLHLPDRCNVVHLGGRKYFVHDDVYYVERPLVGGTRYVVVRPPIGVRVRYLPETAISVRIGGFSFYYCDDTYYRVEYVKGVPEYVVTDVPLGGSILELPDGYERVVVRGANYYRAGGIFYRPYFQEGRVVYVHVAAPW